MNNITVYMSYWSGGYIKDMNEYTLNMHKLSVFLAKKHFKNVHLITDSYSVDHFKSIPYTEITTELDELNGIKNDNWALGKLLAYKVAAQKQKPFLHMDYDVFMWEDIWPHLKNEQVFVQCEECDIGYVYGSEKLKSYCSPKYPYVLDGITQSQNAYNMGIFGGINCEFIEEYATKGIEFSLEETHQTGFKDIAETIYHSAVACCCEQLFLYLYAKHKKINVSYLIPYDNTSRNYDPKYNSLNDEYAHKIGYTHLIGDKKRKDVKQKIYSLVKELNL